MERWIPVSSKKKRSKQAQKSGNPSDHTEEDSLQSTPEQLDYPQPVSKRISIGLPINPYVRSKGKATATNNTQQTHTNDSDSAKTAKRSGQDGLEGDVTHSYFWLAIDCSSDSVSDTNTFQTIRSITKIILRSKAGLTIIPPTSQEVPVIKGNLELPAKGNTRLMHRYIHQGRMLPNTFSGKILVSHPVGNSILSSDVTTAVTSNYPGAKISFDKFGISKLIKIGVLCGTLKHESRQALTAYLEAALSKQINTGYVSIRVTWESIYVNGKNSTSVEAIFIKCRVEDVACATVALSSCMAPPQLTGIHSIPL
jgi:hypothetical protein